MSPSNPTPQTGGGKKNRAKPKRSVKTTDLVEQPHGGKLWSKGPPPGHAVAGPGRPPNAMREAMRTRLDSVVLERWHSEWSDGLVPTKDYAEFLAKYGLGVKDDQSATYEALFTKIRELTLEKLDRGTAEMLLAAFHEAHRTLTEGR